MNDLLLAVSINALTVAAALAFFAPLFILLSIWYARGTVAAGEAEMPVFKTGNTQLHGAEGLAVPPTHPLDAEAARIS